MSANSDFQVDMVVGTTREGASIKPTYTQSENYDKTNVNIQGLEPRGLESDPKKGIGDMVALKTVGKDLDQRSSQTLQTSFPDKDVVMVAKVETKDHLHLTGQDKQPDRPETPGWKEPCLNYMATEWYRQHANIVANLAVGNAIMIAKSSVRKYIHRTQRMRRTLFWDYEDDDEKELVEVTVVSALREAVQHIESLKLTDPYKIKQDKRSVPHQLQRQLIGKRSKKEVPSSREDLVGMAIYMNIG